MDDAVKYAIQESWSSCTIFLGNRGGGTSCANPPGAAAYTHACTSATDLDIP